MIDLNVNEAQRKKNIQRCKEKGILLPTYAQMRDPSTVPEAIKKELSGIGLWDVHSPQLLSRNLAQRAQGEGRCLRRREFRRDPELAHGHQGAHRRTRGQVVPDWGAQGRRRPLLPPPELVTGRFDPTTKKAVWPSTGNYCRGGAYISRLLSCPSIAILPAGMSKERFEWPRTMAEEVIATPGSESNVKEDLRQAHRARHLPRCGHLQPVRSAPQLPLALRSHGSRDEEAFRNRGCPSDRVAGAVLSSGSAGHPRAPAPISATNSPAPKSPWPRPSSAPPTPKTATASTASKASATSTSPGSTTSARPTRPSGWTTRCRCGSSGSSTRRPAAAASRSRRRHENPQQYGPGSASPASEPHRRHQVREVLRARRERCRLHDVHRFDGDVRLESLAGAHRERGATISARPTATTRRLKGIGAIDHLLELTQVGQAADPQPQILHLDRAARQGTCPSSAPQWERLSRVLGRPPLPGRRARRDDRGFQTPGGA